MAIFGLMVMRNEADRYLQSCLTWLRPQVDELFIYDDQSDDLSVEIAQGLGCGVVVRREGTASFLIHEGEFRQQAWNAFEATCQPSVQDWVLANDSDEFLVDAEGRHDSGPGGVLGTLRGACLKTSHATSIILPIPEVFGWLGGIGRPLVRKDGYWGSIRGPRLFRYQKGGHYRNKSMGCGAEPTYVASSRRSSSNYGLHLMHFGYADGEDRQAKYERYSSLGDHGHNDAHIQSIMQAPALENWNGQTPNVWRGVK